MPKCNVASRKLKTSKNIARRDFGSSGVRYVYQTFGFFGYTTRPVKTSNHKEDIRHLCLIAGWTVAYFGICYVESVWV